MGIEYWSANTTPSPVKREEIREHLLILKRCQAGVKFHLVASKSIQLHSNRWNQQKEADCNQDNHQWSHPFEPFVVGNAGNTQNADQDP